VTYLAPAEAAAIDTLAARIEARTGVQIATAIVGRSDAYPEAPWKAFALGASLAAFVTVLADARQPQWVTSYTALVHAAIVLLTGAAAALLAAFVPPFARLFLNAHRADIEVRRYAESLILRRGMFRTRARRVVLILVSLFERRIEIVADDGLQDHVGEADWHAVIARMTPHLRERRPFDALREALDSVDAVLSSKDVVATAAAVVDELPSETIEERGAR
jgi:putative membrane protein